MRFGLFASANADDSSLLTGPTDCSLWSEQITDVSVDSGRFGVTLGESTTLNDTVLAQTSLYLGIAVQGADDAALTVIGKQKLQMVPFAARAAAAKDYKVTGALTAGTVDTGTLFADSGDISGDLDVGGQLILKDVNGTSRVQTTTNFLYFTDTDNNDDDTGSAFLLSANSNYFWGALDATSSAFTKTATPSPLATLVQTPSRLTALMRFVSTATKSTSETHPSTATLP
ncbi:MAG: hypothetical protein GY822_10885 [Deltaproteobacteria bacterium]|nr:hypothetical protein [Deltaproteobacteria bacterium]